MSGLMMLSPGAVFAGDFRIEKPLAEGGMGAVYVAEQLSTGQRRALKVMQPALVPDEKSRQRFLEEARIGGRIDSDHVVQVVAAGVDAQSGVPWLAMELLDGTDVAAHVRHHGARPPAEVLELFEQVGHGLGDAHQRGIVHRDLKPENLFLAKSRLRGAGSTVKILDFGIARTIAESRVAATVTSAIGSPMWMAPEQAVPGAKLTAATDVWALGLIAFYLLTGKSLWLAANHEAFNLPALLVEVMTQPVPPASQRARELGVPFALPPGFDAWLAQCLDRDPQRRLPHAHAAVAGLRAALSAQAALPFAHAATQPLAHAGPTAQSYPGAASYGSGGAAPVGAWATPAPAQGVTAIPSGARSGLVPLLALSGVVVALAAIGGLGYTVIRASEAPDVVATGVVAAARPAVTEVPVASTGTTMEIAVNREDPPDEVPTAAEPTIEVALPAETRTATSGAPARAPEAAPAAEPAPTAEVDDSEVRQAVMIGDSARVIRLLEGRARTDFQLRALIEAYRARGQQQQALGHMRTYVERFPNTPHANTYRQILARHN